MQRHHASHLHYDFRLELDGVLKSWAIPKGPSMNSKDKRLAIMVEDHPYDYKDFEGLIPQGEYGGGVVIIWDQGYYESLSVDRADDIMTLHKGLKEGNLKFRLFGERVKGEFALVKLKNDNSDNNNSWLLIKHKDDFAANEKYDSELFVPNEIKVLKNNKDNEVKTLPNLKIITKKNVKVESKNVESLPELAEFKPMMAKNGASIVINDADKIYEKKLDGYRAISITGKNANLISRNSIDFSIKFPQILSNLLLIDKIIILDGEIVIENKKGKSDFQALQIYNGDTKDYQLVYYVFDILFIDHHDLRNLGLIKRKNLLSVLFESFSKTGKIKLLEFYDDGENLFENAKKESWEGIISKDINSKYLSNKRSDAWLKHKLTLSQETIICGFTMPAGSKKHIGSLILGISVAGKIKYIGNCGTGFDEKSLSDLFNTLEPLITKTPSLNEKIAHKTSIIWVKPKLVCEVVYAEMTKEGRMRHPVFKGLRLDKSTIDLDIELQNVTTNEDNDKLMKIGTKSLKLTNLNKIFWEVENITKGQLLNYYDIMSEHIIPYIKDKPLSMKRQPGGIDDEGFFQKDVDVEKIPKWIKTHNVYSESMIKQLIT
ncbi:MAG: non-homologous end-joining DNA ligase [Bacteroidota bacterium]|nr:non-homologous end-joining DNA ligase [Bacteroidota bacterium]